MLLRRFQRELRPVFEASDAGDTRGVIDGLNALMVRHPITPRISDHDGGRPAPARRHQVGQRRRAGRRRVPARAGHPGLRPRPDPARGVQRRALRAGVRGHLPEPVAPLLLRPVLLAGERRGVPPPAEDGGRARRDRSPGCRRGHGGRRRLTPVGAAGCTPGRRRYPGPVGLPGERRPPHRPVGQDPPARDRPRARAGLPQGDRAVRRARAVPRARAHLPADAAGAVERAGRRPRRRAGGRHAAGVQPVRRAALAAGRRRGDDGPLRPAAAGEEPDPRPGAGLQRPAGAGGGAARQEGRRDDRRARRRRTPSWCTPPSAATSSRRC